MSGEITVLEAELLLVSLPADAYVQAHSNNYSSRNGTLIGTVTIHTIQGTYAGPCLGRKT